MDNFTKPNASMMNRPKVRLILHAGMQAKAYRFVRNLAEIWLASFPGDIEVNTIFAHALIEDQRIDLATPILKRLSVIAPEYTYAHKLLWHSSKDISFSNAKDALGALYSLGEINIPLKEYPQWAINLHDAAALADMGQIDEAHILVQNALAEHPNTPLAAILDIRIAQVRGDKFIIQKLLENNHTRWPDTLFFTLMLADLKMQAGAEGEAVELLHQAASQDIGSLIANRIWGTNHAYKKLWPRNLQAEIELPVPASVASLLGWNQLNQGKPAVVQTAPAPTKIEKTSHAMEKSADSDDEQPIGLVAEAMGADPAQAEPAAPESLLDIREELVAIARRLQQPHLLNGDHRYPNYVIISSRQALEKKFGQEHLPQLQKAMQRVVSSTQAWGNWGAHLIYVDDPQSTDALGIPPIKENTAWKIKQLLSDLDKVFAKKGEMIGAVLIVGGPDIIPFHHLPNPLDDLDAEVLSDNPYATPDENYFIPHWPVGRLPDGNSGKPDLLITLLNTIVDHRTHLQSHRQESRGWRIWLDRILPNNKPRSSFGYTAEVWRRASHAVYRPIGKPQSLMVSPPSEAEGIKKQNEKPVLMSYYNLHGLADSPEWYGHRDPFAQHDGPDYPVALRPEDILNGGSAPQIVFSEACYGAYIMGKDVEDAISLKFMASGSLAMVGSTCTSYGSITTPLIAADLLGKAFWKLIKEGFPAGEALMRSKVHLAREMHKRQGYLDGEDQKTLISFVLYGDPLAQPHIHGATPKSIQREKEDNQNFQIVCDKINPNVPIAQTMPKEMVQIVKDAVKKNLPGMEDARIIYSNEHTDCEGHDCPLPHPHVHAKSLHEGYKMRKLVTLSKNVEKNNVKHPQIARITFDEKGNVVKLAVSR